MKRSVQQIVKIADIFDKHVKCFLSDRYWALSVLAEVEAEDNTNPQYKNPISDITLARQIKRLANINPTPEEWSNWVKANEPAIEKVLSLYWTGDSVNYSLAEVDWDFKLKTYVYAFLSLNPTLPNEKFNSKETFMLKGVGLIPNLFIQIGTMDKSYDTFIFPPEIAHDSWLYEAFQRLFHISYSPIEIEHFTDFIRTNKSVLRKIRSSFAISVPKYLGGGVDGAAFDIGEGKVLKIFRDIDSFEKSKAAFERLHKNPDLAKTEAMIYDIGLLGNYKQDNSVYTKPHQVYYYIIEKMTPLNEIDSNLRYYIKDIMSEIVRALTGSKDTKWRAIKAKIDDPKYSAQIKKEVEEWAKVIANNLKTDASGAIEEVNRLVPNLRSDWVQKYAEEIIMKYLTGRTDLHMGNIGVTGFGLLRYFDPAYGNLGSSINY